jgi:hypothetical protein
VKKQAGEPKKTAGKTAGPKPALVRRPNGSALYAGGVPGNPGGGRKPDEFKARMQELASHVERAGYVTKVLEDPKHPAWLGAVKYVTEFGYGKAPQKVEVSGADGEPLTVKIVRE